MHPINDPQIDLDHDRIILAFDALCEAARTGESDPRRHGELVDQLSEYLTTHFAREQRLMEALGYPDAGQHEAAHHALQARFGQRIASLREAGPDLCRDVARMREVFLAHILTHDELFGEWMAARNASPADPEVVLKS